jgi:hypothetical protein
MEGEGSWPMVEALCALRLRGKRTRDAVRQAIDAFTANAGRMDDPT